MFTVYIAGEDELRTQLSDAVKQIPGVVFNGSTSNLREALEECAAEQPGVLVVDDALIAQNIGMTGALDSVPYPIVVIAPSADVGAARRALAIRARDFISRESWASDLAPILSRIAIPLAGEERAEGKVLAIFSSKGGVGKTTLTVNLAVALAKSSRQPVAIFDLDVQFGDVAPMVGEAPLATLYDVVKGVTHVDPEVLKRAMKRVANNVYLLAAPDRPEEADDIRADHIVQILQLLRESYAYVLVDTAPGYTDINVAAFDYCDNILTVCTPDVVTLRTVGQALQVFFGGFHYPPEKIRIVLNRSGSKTGVETEDVAQVLQTPLSYLLPSDGASPVHAANDGQPLLLKFPDSALSKSIQNMANAIVKETGGRQRAEEKKLTATRAFFSRVMGHSRF